MTVEMSRGKRILFMIAICISNIAVMGDMYIIPIVNDLYAAFPAAASLVNGMVSGPSLVVVAVSLLTSSLITKIPKKTLLMFGGILSTVAGILGAAIMNPWYMLIMRLLFGAGYAIINVVAVAMVTDVYVDETKRASMMGIYNGVMAAIGVAMSPIAGMLAANGWVNVFKGYWAQIPMLVVMALFIPSIRLEKDQTEQNAAVEIGKEPYGLVFWITLVCFMIHYLNGGIFLYYISVYAAEHSLGDTVYVGVVNSIYSATSFLGCLCFGTVYGKLKGKTSILPYFLAGACFLTLYLVPNSILLMIATGVYGFCQGIVMNFAWTHAPASVPESRVSSSIGLVSGLSAAATFISTYFATFLMSAFHTDGAITPVYIVPVILCVVIAVGSFAISRREAKQG